MGILDPVASPLDDAAAPHVVRAAPIDGDYPRVIANGVDTNTIPHHAGVESHADGEVQGRHFYVVRGDAETET
ncbi:MAG: hypothetical protein ACRDJU_14060 [Actinomycetota bacterium]